MTALDTIKNNTVTQIEQRLQDAKSKDFANWTVDFYNTVMVSGVGINGPRAKELALNLADRYYAWCLRSGGTGRDPALPSIENVKKSIEICKETEQFPYWSPLRSGLAKK